MGLGTVLVLVVLAAAPSGAAVLGNPGHVFRRADISEFLV